MDNLTHTLTAVALSQAGLNRKTRFATLTLIAAANLPDLDIISGFWGTAAYLKYHRGFTHSILGASLLAFLLAWTVYVSGRRMKPKSGPPLSLRWLCVSAWIGTASHLLMDFTNAYGVRPFIPFSYRWYAWDIVPIIDPLLLLLLCLGLSLPLILRLVSEEVGAHRYSPAWGAVFSLCAMVFLWGLRDVAHRRALEFIASHTYSQENPLRIGAFPSPANPFEWLGVVETDSAFHVFPESALEDKMDPRTLRQFYKPDASPALNAALKTQTGRIFMDFARFPWNSAQETPDGYDVTLSDLRFDTDYSGRRLVAQIEMDKNLQARSESIQINAPHPNGQAK